MDDEYINLSISRFYDNETADYYYANRDLYYKRIQELNTIDRERKVISYVYHAFAGCIVLLNVLLVVSILISRKQRRHFRSWLILHMTFLHILYAAIGLPFLAQMKHTTFGKYVALCKLLYFLSDVLQYMSNISIGMLGVYQCMNVISPRLLKSVSNVLLGSIMIVLPWLVAVMLTTVLRLTMSEEQFGQCYLVSDHTADVLWSIVAFYLPLALIAGCFFGIVIISFSKFRPKFSSPQPQRRSGITLFVLISLSSTLLMRLPLDIMMFPTLLRDCYITYGHLVCSRIINGLDVTRLISMVIIPSAYIIQKEVSKRCRKLKSKILCRTVEYKPSIKKQQTLELKSMTTSEGTVWLES